MHISARRKYNILSSSTYCNFDFKRNTFLILTVDFKCWNNTFLILKFACLVFKEPEPVEKLTQFIKSTNNHPSSNPPSTGLKCFISENFSFNTSSFSQTALSISLHYQRSKQLSTTVRSPLHNFWNKTEKKE